MRCRMIELQANRVLGGRWPAGRQGRCGECSEPGLLDGLRCQSQRAASFWQCYRRWRRCVQVEAEAAIKGVARKGGVARTIFDQHLHRAASRAEQLDGLRLDQR